MDFNTARHWLPNQWSSALGSRGCIIRRGRQLGLAYGAAAVNALEAGKDGAMVAFVPPDIKYVPLEDAINRVRTVTKNNEFIQIARFLGIFFGGKQS